MGANDWIDWGQFGGNLTEINSGSAGVTAKGIGFRVYSTDYWGVNDGGKLQILQEGEDLFAGYEPGTLALAMLDREGAIRIDFDVAVGGVGSDSRTNRFGGFQTDMSFYGTSGFLGDLWRLGSSGPIFVGGVSDSFDIKTVYFAPFMLEGQESWGHTLNSVSVVNPVPEPATCAALAAGLLALRRRRR